MVFVYGTLRKGGVREMSRAVPSAIDRGAGSVEGLLYDFGAYPGLAIEDVPVSDRMTVQGELYEVDEAGIARLDQIEQYFPDSPSTSYYVRIRVPVRRDSDDAGREAGGEGTVQAWTYQFNPAFFSSTDLVPGGDWIAHLASKTEVPDELWPSGKPIET